MDAASNRDAGDDVGPAPALTSATTPIVLYDGVCGLCNRTVTFLLRHDRSRRLRFAALQGQFGVAARRRHHLSDGEDDDSTDAAPSSIVLLENPGTPFERVRVRSDAVLAVVAGLGGPWRLVALARILPRFIRDAVYAAIARVRYRIFGRLDACPMPAPSDRDRFVD